jgi:hypothetical protein
VEEALGENQLSASSSQARVEAGATVDLVDAVDRVEVVRALQCPLRAFTSG